MNDYHAFRASAIRYWERRRIIYNLALVPPAFFAFMLGTAISYAGDNPYNLHPYYRFTLFGLCAFGANICYSFAYALEFLFGSDHPNSRWLRFGRRNCFAGGVLIGMVLAFAGGAQIAIMEFYYH